MSFKVMPEPAFSNGRATGPALVRDDDRQWVMILRQELDEYYDMIKAFHSSEPDQVLLQVSGISARLTELRAILMRNGGQKANKFRTSEVDPLLEQLKLQAQLHSRLITVRDLDFRLSGGQT